MAESHDIASILDEALDDLEKCEEVEAESAQHRQIPIEDSKVRPSDSKRATNEIHVEEDGLDFKGMLSQFVEGCDDEKGQMSGQTDFEQFVRRLEEDLSQIETPSSPIAGKKVIEEHFTTTLATILDEISEPVTQEGSNGNGKFQQGTSEKHSNLSGGILNADHIVDGMMEQLLSKDLMYEPLREVSDRFPAWIEANTELLSEDEATRYQKQELCFRKLVQAYETDPSNIALLLALMQEVQEYGQPPQDIIDEIAPGLNSNFDINEINSFGAGIQKIDDCNLM